MPRGFGGMSRERVQEIASRGGKAAHKKGTAHEWTSATARDAAKKSRASQRRGRQAQALTKATTE